MPFKKRYKITTLCLHLVVILFISVYIIFLTRTPVVDEVSVSFFDVGQGDATFIESPHGVQILIDGGRGSDVLSELAHSMDRGDKTISLLVATHYDADHIGGLIDVLNNFSVEQIYLPLSTKKNAIREAFDRAVSDEGARVVYIDTTRSIDFGDGMILEFLVPQGKVLSKDENENSLVTRILFGESEVLLTGDLPQRGEYVLVSEFGEALESDVLKVGHHGSNTSTSTLFLDAVQPLVATISASATNPYGHPHHNVLARLDEYSVDVYETKNGTITVLLSRDGTRDILQSHSP